MTLLTAPAPSEPGLYPGVDALVYHSWPGASQSRLKVLRDRSPAHVRWQMDCPSPPTPAMRLGAAIHTAVLEPDDFPALYVRGIKGDGRTKAVQAAREALALECPEAEVLSPHDYDTCLAVRDSVARHPLARVLLGGAHESSAVWMDEAGPLCRGRFDCVTSLGAITDLKTTVDASPFRFPRTVYDYGYHIQAAMYLRGAKRLGLDVDSFGIVAVEKEPPCAVACYQLNAACIADGERELVPLLERWHECVTSGLWPSYAEDVVVIDLPGYAPHQITERLDVSHA